MTIKEIYNLYSEYYLVDTDTRNIRKNSIFFALKGENFNGNKYAEEAIKKGANYAIVDEKEYKTTESVILVDNVLQCLQELAAYHREILNVPILALTGSNGKTTTKELINAVLSRKFNTVATQGNLNNHIGVPLTLLSMTDETEFGIVEMGANHLNEISFLSNIAKPNFGYITNFGKAHLEGFGNIEGVIKGKSELYDYLKSTHGKVFVNQHDEIQLKQSEGIHTVPFEETIAFIDANPSVKISFKNLEIESQLIGSYNFNNIAAAITIGNYFDIDSTTVKTALENYISTNNRSQVIQKNDVRIIMDAYNANPSSMQAALENFKNLEASSKIAILGDMFELGETAVDEHQKIAEFAEELNLKLVFLIGELFSKTATNDAIKFIDFDTFKNNYNSTEFSNSTLLIKGSRGMKLERILDLF
ncbi:MAG: UDP-N-acetylmuramoyl-tripeptide--D-alanyl-D-alanine ligase [Candidatus Azotimanducaceae bacterium]|jgi:UDP-N-acetylmuramoyl-tripeptide--D-alanyl-D-alanine ligase